MLKGDPGGYYVPEVDEEGNLTWTPSDEDMTAVDASNIQGPQGVKGESGVYVGETEPTDESLVWINPEGTASEGLVTTGYVDEALKDKVDYYFIYYGGGSEITEADKATLEEILRRSLRNPFEKTYGFIVYYGSMTSGLSTAAYRPFDRVETSMEQQGDVLLLFFSGTQHIKLQFDYEYNLLDTVYPEIEGDAYATTRYVDKKIAEIDVPTGGDEVFVGNEAPTDENIKIWVDPNEQLNFATTEYVDNAIANIDIPEGEIVDEVFVGTAEPTDENVKIWVNPEEQLDFATIGYVDNAIANIDIPEGEIVDEVYVGNETPTDENVKIWVNPDEQMNFATTEYVDEAIANIDIPEGGSADIDVFQPAQLGKGELIDSKLDSTSPVVVEPTAEFISALNLQPDTVYYIYTLSSWSSIAFISTVNGSESSNFTQINWSSSTGYFSYNSINSGIKAWGFQNNVGNYVAFKFSAPTDGTAGLVPAPAAGDVKKFLCNDGTWQLNDPIQPKDWHWVNHYDAERVYDIDNYTHLKVVCCDNDNRKILYSFDISTNSGNSFSEESGSYYYCSWYDTTNSKMDVVEFYNEGGYTLWISGSANGKMTVLGYYYWG